MANNDSTAVSIWKYATYVVLAIIFIAIVTEHNKEYYSWFFAQYVKK